MWPAEGACISRSFPRFEVYRRTFKLLGGECDRNLLGKIHTARPVWVKIVGRNWGLPTVCLVCVLGFVLLRHSCEGNVVRLLWGQDVSWSVTASRSAMSSVPVRMSAAPSDGLSLLGDNSVVGVAPLVHISKTDRGLDGARASMHLMPAEQH